MVVFNLAKGSDMQRVLLVMILSFTFLGMTGAALDVQSDVICHAPKSYKEIKLNEGYQAFRGDYDGKYIITETTNATKAVNQWIYDHQGNLLVTSSTFQWTPAADYMIHTYEGLIVFTSPKSQFIIELGGVQNPENQLEDSIYDVD